MPGYFHHRLEDLKRLLLSMGGLVENQLLRATNSLLDGDGARAQYVIALDADVDALEMRVDEACVQLLALYQPAAADLRFVAAAMKVVTELERVGDQAVDIARFVLGPRLPAELMESGVKPMAELARNMVSESVKAVARADAAAGRKVIAGDAALDVLEEETVGALLVHAALEPALLHSVFRLAYAARSLERIGDHATNIAEMAVYISDGRLERHGPSLGLRRSRAKAPVALTH